VAAGRFTKMVNTLTIREEYKAVIKITWLLSIVALYIHIVACVWFYVVSIKDVWIPHMDFAFKSTSNIQNDPTGYKYIECFYYMVLCIGGNELTPVTALECATIVIFMLAAALINASIFGEMSFFATVLAKK
jgi:hypothetical protein